MLARILATLAAALLVGAVAIATMVPQDLSLGEMLAAADHVHLAAVEAWVRTHLSGWVWDHPAAALLVRPIWVLPSALGLLALGGAVTAANAQKAPNSRRRRS